MRVYTVHIDPVSAADDRGTVLVREGFSWPAALFTVFWALYHRLWYGAALLLALGLALGAMLAWLGLGPLAETALEAGYLALVGFTANDWRRAALTRRGWLLADVVAARNAAQAEQRLFDRQAAAAW